MYSAAAALHRELATGWGSSGLGRQLADRGRRCRPRAARRRYSLRAGAAGRPCRAGRPKEPVTPPLVVHAAQDDPRSRSHRAGLSPGCERAWAGLRCRPPGQTACTGSRPPPTTSATPH